MSRAFIFNASIIIAICISSNARAQTLQGRVVDDSLGQAVAAARVLMLNAAGDSVADVTTDADGRFVLQTVPGVYRLQVLRVGFSPTATGSFWLREGVGITNLTITVPATARDDPVMLAPLLIEGRVTSRHLDQFYRHRDLGLGDFVTREQFESWNPTEVTDVVRRMPSFVVRGNPTYGHNINGTMDTRRYRIEVATRSRRRNQECPVLIYLDGAYVGDTVNHDLESFALDALEAVETFSRPAQMPPEYNRLGADCGVIGLWTRSPQVTNGNSSVEFGLRYGASLKGGDLTKGRVGFHFVVPLVGPVEFYPAFHINVDGASQQFGGASAAWQVQLGLRLWPAIQTIPLFVGGSLAVEKLNSPLFGRPAEIDSGYTFFTGSAVALGPARPFAEVHVLDLFSSNRELQTYLGLGVQF
ncbi:MAG: TonB-dependent receptor [Gemmatimonadetes bacterium]|nr:TonB-dependent receptor [Gemmatimonadota bacterium]